MSLIMQFLSILLTITLIGCDNSGSENTNTDSSSGGNSDLGSSGLPTPTPAPVSFTQNNYEAEPKYIGPRAHAIVGEVYRNLWLIHQDTIYQGTDIETKMADASAVPSDDLFDVIREVCTNTAGITTKFIDNGTPGFSSGDQILRDFDNFGCEYDFVDTSTSDLTPFYSPDNRPPHFPTKLTGSILYEFTAGNSGAGTYAGTATFGDPDPLVGLNYEIENGLLKVLPDETVTDAFNGTVTFDIDFTTGAATFTDINIGLTSGSSSLTAPTRITINSISRSINPGGENSVTIVGGSITSELSGDQITFSTVNFNDGGAPSTDDSLRGAYLSNPNEGSIVFEGANNTAARARTDTNGGSGIIELDTDGDDAYNDSPEADGSGWGFFVSAFLMPNQALNIVSDDAANHDSTPFIITLVFSQSISGLLVPADFTVSGATIAVLSPLDTVVTRSLLVTPDGSNNDIDISLNANVVTSELGILNEAQSLETIPYMP